MGRLAADKTVVVLGAGINGAAVARELLLSGVSVVMVDASDIASGATAWSTRLIHGGLRYLEYGELGLVRESLAERNRLVRLAPHLVKPLEVTGSQVAQQSRAWQLDGIPWPYVLRLAVVWFWLAMASHGAVWWCRTPSF